MQNAKIPILGFAAFSGTGKTTLLTQVIPALTASGLRIGLVKHSHHDFQIDQPGKDSYRLRQAGAETVMIVSSHRRAVITEITPAMEPKLSEQLLALDQSQLDLILVEGFKAEKFPKIELHRPSLEKPLLYPNDPDIIAVATDRELDIPEYLTKLDINQPHMIAEFILNRFMAEQ
jgi:molybdopterin-guanine dinucleotide biosynthesis adapter protein